MFFQIKAKHVLFTYNELPLEISTHPITTPSQKTQLVGDVKKEVDKHRPDFPDKVSFCIEELSRRHLHIARTSDTQIDCQVSPAFDLYDKRPSDIQPNTTKGSGYNTSRDRTHFYVQCQYKKGYIGGSTNYVAGRDFVVKEKWILDLWKTRKIADEDVEACLVFYNCATQRALLDIMVNIKKRKHEHFIELDRDRTEVLSSMKRDFKSYELFDIFREQFSRVDFRYNFLIITGRSKLGKTLLAKHQFTNPFMHCDVICWQGYDPVEHDCVIFDDVKDIYRYVVANKALFQSNDYQVVQTSSTNCHSMRIRLIGVPLIITYNTPPQNDWIHANSYHIHLDEPTYFGDGDGPP